MANPEQVALVTKSVAEWNRWRQEDANVSLVNLWDAGGTHMYLTTVDLTGADLQHADLANANLI